MKSAVAAVFGVVASSVAAGGLPFLPKTAPTNEVRVAVAVQQGNNMPIVRGAVNGRSCTFLLDTGATHTTIDEGFVKRALSELKLEKVALGGTTNVEKAPSLVHVSSVSIGCAVFTDFDLMVLDISHLVGGIGVKVDGVLGMNVLGCVNTLISLGSGEVVFSPGPGSVVGFSKSVRRKSSDPLSIAMTAERGGKSFDVIVDSGASFTFLSSSVGWPVMEGKAMLRTVDVNGSGGLSPTYGERGELTLGIPLELTPLVVSKAESCIGSDTLLRYDMLVGFRRVFFRPHRRAAAEERQ